MGCCMSKTKKSRGSMPNARPVETVPVPRRGRQSYQSSYAESWDTIHEPSRGLTPSYYGSSTSSIIHFNIAGDAFDGQGKLVGRSRLPSARDFCAY